MRFRTKLLLLLLSITVFTNGVCIAMVYFPCRRLIYDEIRSKVLSVASTAAVLLDGDLHQAIRKREDEAGREYARLEAMLRRVRDINRRSDVYVKYIYTLRPTKAGGEKLEFVLDPEEGKNKSHVGEIYKELTASQIGSTRPRVDKEFTKDKWGRWLTATAPIRDRAGGSVASVGVDIEATSVLRRLRLVLFYVLGAFGLALALSLVGGFWISRRVSRPLHLLRESVLMVGEGDLEIQVPIRSRDEFGEVGRAVEEMAKGLREREMLKTGFARYVSKDVVDSILESGQMPGVEGKREEVTVLFSDIRGFTKLSEHLAPEEVVALLNDYFETMIEVVFHNNGTLDKFMGDGMMVLFGAPLSDPDHAVHAVKAATEMQAALKALHLKWGVSNRPAFAIGIGIHTGPAVVGNVGSTRRLEYTAIGDTVNLASRLESSTKDLGRSIVLSEATHLLVNHRYKTLPLGQISVKGRETPVSVYGLEEP